MQRFRSMIVLGFMLVLLFGGNFICRAADPTVREQEAGVEITTKLYKVFFSKEKGYTIESMTNRRSGGVLESHVAGLVILEDPNPREWREGKLRPNTEHHENEAKAKCKIQKNDNTIVCTILWKNAAVKVEKTMIFSDDSPVIDIRYRVKILRPLQDVGYFLSVWEKSFKKKVTFIRGRPVLRTFRRFSVRSLSSPRATPTGTMARTDMAC